MVGWLPLFAAPAVTGFNGGRSQVNLNFLDQSGSYPFLNILKTALAWAPGDFGNNIVPPSILDADGYCIDAAYLAAHNNIRTDADMPTQAERPGNYCITWDGAGSITTITGGSILGSATGTASISGNVMTVSSGSGWTPGQLVAATGIVAYTIVVSQSSGPAGGAGSYIVTGSQTLGSRSMTGSGGSTSSSSGLKSGYYATTIAQSRNNFTFAITGIGSSSDYVKNVQIFHVDDAPALLDRGEVFGAKFKAQLAASRYGVIRFLNWQIGNTTNVTTWATRKAASYVFYAGYELRNALYCTSSTSLSGQAYSITGPSGFALVDKVMVHALIGQSYNPIQVTFPSVGNSSISMPANNLPVGARLCFSIESDPGAVPTNFTANTRYYVVGKPDADHIQVSLTPGGTAVTAGSAQTGTIYGNPFLTWNVSGTGDIDILDAYSGFLSFGGNSYPVGGSFRSISTLVYDATLNAWIKQGGDIGEGSTGINNGCPPELMLQLCKEVGAHAWFITPPLAIDPATDYMPSLALATRNYIAANATWMIPRFEGPNELWNFGAGFFQTGHANAKGVAYGWGAGNYNNWYGKEQSVLGQICGAIFGKANLGVTYQFICGIQTITAGNPNNDPRMNSALYIADGVAQSPLTGAWGTITFSAAAGTAEAYRWTSHVCVANYINSSEYGQSIELTRSAAFKGVRFVADIVAGLMTVSSFDTAGGALAIGKTVFGRGIAGGVLQSGVTIVSGSALAGWQLSDSSINLVSDTFYAADTAGMGEPALYVDGLAGTASFGPGFNLAAINSYFIAAKSWAITFGVANMCCYEGCFSPDYPLSGPTVELAIFRFASKLVASSPGSPTGLRGYTYGNTPSNYQNLLDAGGEFPSNYLLSGAYASNIAWPVLEDLYQPDPPQQLAIIAFNH